MSGRRGDDYGYGGYAPYVRVADRRVAAAKEAAKLKKKGHAVSPVVIDGRAIARTFWGKAWCDNLEAYSDYSNRLPRGRTYVRNGSVIDLQVASGEVTALVSGSSIYRVGVSVTPVAEARWKALGAECAGTIDSLVELLAGKLSKGVMERLCRRDAGLFPAPREMRFRCSCPDGAHMCKHVAAALYGVGARLDARPELLFTLRHVDAADLIAKAGASSALRQGAPAPKRALADDDLASMFGIELDEGSPPPPVSAKAPAKRPARLETVTSKDLIALGIPRSTFQNWITSGELAQTDVRGAYRVTPAARARIARRSAR